MKITFTRSAIVGLTLCGAVVSSPLMDRSEAKPSRSAPKIIWQSSFEKALAAAKRTGKPIMVDFYADWCGPCKMLDRDVWTKAPVIRESRNWINVKVDGDKRTDLMRRYKIDGFPTIAFLKPNGNVSKFHQLSAPPSLHSKPKQLIEHFVRDMTNSMRTQRLKAVSRRV